MWIRKSGIAAVSFLLITASIACAADDMQAARAVVTGPENRVHEFHQNLQGLLAALLADSDAASTLVLCDVLGESTSPHSCEDLRENKDDSIKLQYTFFRDNDRMMAFAASWNRLQTRKVDEEVELKFHMRVPSPTCPTTCVAAPFCAGPPRGCDKVRGAPCTVCTSP